MPPTIKTVYCDYVKQQYYDKQGQFCKRCDRCMKGWGEADFKDGRFTIDPENGALGCLHCVKCKNGTYSSTFSYGQCQPCRNCQNENRYIVRECSSTQNAVCGGVITVPPSSLKQSSTTTTDCKAITLGVSLSLVGIFLVIAVIGLLYRRRKRRSKQNANKSIGKLNSTSEMTKMISSTSTFSSEGKASDSGVETDGSLTCIAEVHCNKSLTEKIEQWKTSHDCSIEFSSKHAQMISKHIAVNDNYSKIGIHLGLTDTDIKVIQIDHTGCETHAYHTLIKWKEVEASNATVGTFLEALQSLELFDIAESFCNKSDDMNKRM